MLFRKKIKDVCLVDISNGYFVTTTMEVGKYIESLRLENKNLKHMVESLNEELMDVKKFTTNATFKQAMSKDCINCKYVMASSWDDRILCCIKDNVCDDFTPREE